MECECAQRLIHNEYSVLNILIIAACDFKDF